MFLGKKVYRRDKLEKVILKEGSGHYYYSNYPKIYIKNISVEISSLDNSMEIVLKSINNYALSIGIKGFIITSGNDGKEHKSGSLHYKNRAIDISFREAVSNKPFTSFNAVIEGWKKEIVRLGGKVKDFDIILESNHFHIEYDPKSDYNKKLDSTVESLKESTTPLLGSDIEYYHNDYSITSVIDLFNQKKELFKNYKSVEELLDYSGKGSITNRRRVERMYSSRNPNHIYPFLVQGTKLIFSPEKINYEFLLKISENQVISTRKFPVFFAESKKNIEESPKYRPTLRGNSISFYNSFVSVWVYLKSVDKVVNITPFCSKVNVSSSKVVSTFEIDLSPTYDYTSNQLENYYIFNGKSWSTILTENDIVFIKFEELEVESRFIGNEIPKSELANQIYDFIGLVDVAYESMDLTNSTYINGISGRCFSKLFTDDEATFFPYSVVTDSVNGNLLMGKPSEFGLLNRLFVDGQNYSLFSKDFRSIEDTMKFYVNQISTMGILPEGVDDSLFASYGNRRTKLYGLKGTEKPELKDIKAKGVYQIIKFWFDPSVKSRRIVDSSVTNPEGSILSLFYKICQEPFVEVLTDTYGDTYNVIVRKPPFDKNSITENLKYNDSLSENSYSIRQEDISSINTYFEDNFFTWFQLYNRGVFVGMDKYIALTRVPIIYFSEYINLWGPKKSYVEYNYARSEGLSTDLDKQQVIEDLIYILESQLYLPFTKRGTITMQNGDRRIKKGTWIEIPLTGEIYYIDSVVNTVAISNSDIIRTTTLNVSRGMVKRFIEGYEINGIKYSYFNIVNLDDLKKALEDFLINNKSSISKSVLVNPEQFDFFVKKKQYE